MLIGAHIRWIAFDAVGTLIFSNPKVSAVYHRVACELGSKLTEHEISRRFAAAFRASEQSDENAVEGASVGHGFATSESREFSRWQSIVAQVIDDIERPDECFQRLFAHFGRPESWSCYDDVGPVLTALRQRGFRLAVASNFDNRLNTICDGIAALRSIELRMISSLVGHRKPSRQFYEALLARARCRPDELVMIGDNEANDIGAAHAVGIPAIHICRNGPASREQQIATLAELL